MVESINAKVEYVTDGTSFMGPVSYGKIMIGDRGFEFYDDRDVRNFIQIPWDEIDLVIAHWYLAGIGFLALRFEHGITVSSSLPPRIPRQLCALFANTLILSIWSER